MSAFFNPPRILEQVEPQLSFSEGQLMTRNPILEEIYSARQQILAEYGGDLGAYIRSANERAKASGHPIANLEQRTIRWTEVANSGDSQKNAQPNP